MIFDKRNLKYSIVCFLSGILLILFIITTPGCEDGIPSIDVSFWAGDAQKGGITRAQDQKTISCSDPQINAFTCMSYDDLKKVYGLLQRCKQWD